MTTAYYTRVSTDTQDPERQVEEIRDHLGEAAFRDARAYADVASGTKDDREEFQQLWQDIEAGEIDRLVTWEMSRLSRRLSTAADFMESCAQSGTALETLNDMFPNLHGGGEDDIWDELMAKFSAWMMEFEREMTRERVRSGVRKAIDEGKWVGRPPYGFETDDGGFLRVQADEYIRMQLAIEEVLFNDKSVNSVANQYHVPQSTLNRVADDEDRRNLYLYGEGNDDRLTSAVEDSDIEDEGELADLRERIEALEDQVGE